MGSQWRRRRSEGQSKRDREVKQKKRSAAKREAQQKRCPRTGKYQFPTEERAREEVALIASFYKARISVRNVPSGVFLCQTCQKWHITSAVRRQKRS